MRGSRTSVLRAVTVVSAAVLTSISCGREDSSLPRSDRGAVGTLEATIREPSDSGGMPATLRDVRTALQGDSAVRVVFEFAEPRLPGYSIGYSTQPPTACGSGKALAIEAKAYLGVRLSPAQAHTARGEEQVATAEPRDRRPALGPLDRLIETCDFEGVVQWVLGLRERLPYRAFTLKAPTRLVIDLLTDSSALSR